MIDWDHPERVSCTRARVCVCGKGSIGGGTHLEPPWFHSLVLPLTENLEQVAQVLEVLLWSEGDASDWRKGMRCSKLNYRPEREMSN